MPSNTVNFTEISYTVPYGDESNSVAIGDFNGDGQPDVVLPHVYHDTISVLLNDGKNGFNPPASYATDDSPSTGSGPYSVAVDDFNGDGKVDIVVGNFNATVVSILLNNGSGGFSAPKMFSSGSISKSVVIGDFNNDGKKDIVAGGRMLLGNGDGSFGAPTTISSSLNFVAVGDFNGDGKTDLVGTSVGTNQEGFVSVLFGDGSGRFGSSTPFSSGGNNPGSVAVGDFNGDGKLDLAVDNRGTQDASGNGNVSSSKVTILLNNGSSSFSNQASILAPDQGGIRSIAAGDFNGDGKIDIATNEYSNSSPDLSGVFVRLNVGSGDFGNPIKVSLGYSNYLTGDFNGDGKADLAGVGSLLLSKAEPTPLPAPSPSPAPSPAPNPVSNPAPAPKPIGNSPNEITATPPEPINFGKNKGIVLKDSDRTPVLVGRQGNDRLLGGKGNNLLKGNDGNDLLNGGKGNDKLLAGKGDDILVGGAGKDMLTGGSGRDSFVYNSIQEGSDTLTDFQLGQDLIDLRSIFKQAAFQIVGGSNFTRFQQFIKLEQVGANTQVKVDVDGASTSATFVTIATLKNIGVTAIDARSFVIG